MTFATDMKARHSPAAVLPHTKRQDQACLHPILTSNPTKQGETNPTSTWHFFQRGALPWLKKTQCGGHFQCLA
jgi:hypothetical protein